MADNPTNCPFCGGNAYVTKGYSANENVWPGDFWRVFCGSCQVRQLFHRSDAEAVSAWNRRSDSAAGIVQAEIDRAEALLNVEDGGAPVFDRAQTEAGIAALRTVAAAIRKETGRG